MRIYGGFAVIKLEELADASLKRDALRLNSLVQDLWRSGVPLSSLPKPVAARQASLVIIAALLELLAQQWRQAPPAWTREIGAMPQPFFFSKYAEKMPNLRRQCETDSPLPLKKRGLYAPPDFLTFV